MDINMLSSDQFRCYLTYLKGNNVHFSPGFHYLNSSAIKRHFRNSRNQNTCNVLKYPFHNAFINVTQKGIWGT